MRAGAPKPDISSTEALKRALLDAKSIAYSSSASGVYLQELFKKPVKGIDYVGPLPPDIQQVTIFSAGIPKSASNAAAARALIDFLSSTSAAPAIKKSGMEPITQ